MRVARGATGLVVGALVLTGCGSATDGDAGGSGPEASASVSTSATETPTAAATTESAKAEARTVGSSMHPAELASLITEAVYAAGTSNLELVQEGESLNGTLHTTETEARILLDAGDGAQFLLTNEVLYVRGLSDEAEWVSFTLDDATYGAMSEDPGLAPLLPVVALAQLAGVPHGLLDEPGTQDAVVTAVADGSSTYEAQNVSDEGSMVVAITVDARWLPSQVDVRLTPSEGETTEFSMLYAEWGNVEALSVPQGSDVAPYQP